MPRVYSRSGCARCKLRKKKCGEERPVCSACAAWNWSCSYESSPRDGAASTKALQLTRDQLGILLPTCCDDENEATLLRDVPDTIKTFYSPTSGQHIRDLQVMWQLMTSNHLLRHSVVACFSIIAQDPAAMAELHLKTYGKALQSLRTSMVHRSLDLETMICVIASVVFLGKMESFGPSSFAEPLQHWLGLIQLLCSAQYLQLNERRQIPFSENMLIYESMLFHVGTQGMFSSMVHQVYEMWQTNDIYSRICILNPPGPERMSRSPLLCGQYEPYHMALYVTHLLRDDICARPSSPTIENLKARIHFNNQKLDSDFANAGADSLYHETERATYHMFCNSLLICATALEEPSLDQSSRIKQLAQTGLAMFLHIPEFGDVEVLSSHANHFMLSAIWPIQIQACATPDINQLEIFKKKYLSLEHYLDPGHRRRAGYVLERVSSLLNKTSKMAAAEDLPAGLKLLRIHLQAPATMEQT